MKNTTQALMRELRIQRLVGWLLMVPFGGTIRIVLNYVARYRMPRLKEHRAAFRKLVLESKEPLLICSNHLTFIDSVLMLWAFGSDFWYIRHFRAFSWNLPAGDFFKKKFFYRFVAYLSKCIFIHRDGSASHKESILSACKQLLLEGEVVTIFPEGKRSRSGRIEPEGLTYGAAKLVHEIPGCRVLCVYVRGDKQERYGNYPARDSVFYFDTRLIRPTSQLKGREAYREIMGKIATELKDMEAGYFAEVKPAWAVESTRPEGLVAQQPTQPTAPVGTVSRPRGSELRPISP